MNILSITTLVLQNLLQGFTPLCFYGLLRALSLQSISLFFSQTCISYHGCKKSFKFMMLRLLENTFVSQNIESVYSCAFKQNSPLEGQDYGAENMTKIKPARVLVTSFDKFHHLQPLHFWFLFCFAII